MKNCSDVAGYKREGIFNDTENKRKGLEISQTKDKTLQKINLTTLQKRSILFYTKDNRLQKIVLQKTKLERKPYKSEKHKYKRRNVNAEKCKGWYLVYESNKNTKVMDDVQKL